MPYEPIHHKYRPQTFKDLVGQETIALTLSNALKQEKIAAAYLFTGPRGTGKTSSARILAKSLNCLTSEHPTPEPCGKCEVCLAIAKGSALDVMEIDAASNTGVDNIREIIERSRFAPVQCRYKVYAIDECHMLSTAAFNALLKTLEEPPPQVVFILATTDPQRVLSTIISRCQRFDFRRIPLSEMVNHLRYIADAEKIAIANEALNLIASIANGGLRDAESLLDQLSLLPDTISVEKVWDLVGAVPEQDLLKLIHLINQDDSMGVLQQCRSLLDRGREPIVVLQNLASFYLNLLIAKTAPQCPNLVAVTETCWQQLCNESNSWDTGLILRGQQHLQEAETQLKKTTQPRLWLEVTLLGLLPQAHQAVSPRQVDPVINRVTNVSPPTNDVLEVLAKPAQNISVNHQNEAENSNVSHTNKAELPTQAPEKPPELVEVSQPAVAEVPTLPADPSPEPVDEPAPVTPDAPPPQATDSNVDIEGIWRKVLSCLQPPTTQALLKQQCHLISFDGSSAIVGISSATLQKLNQGKVPNIEKAFAQVVQHKVRVQLEVASSKGNSAKKNSTVASDSVQPPSQTLKPLNVPDYNQQTPQTNKSEPLVESKTSGFILENKIKVNENEPKHDFNNPINPPSENLQPAKHLVSPPTQIQPDVALDTPQITPQTTVEPDLDSDYGDSDLQKAIANLTLSFEGELVQMDNDEDLSLDIIEDELESANNEQQGRPNIEDYDDDW